VQHFFQPQCKTFADVGFMTNTGDKKPALLHWSPGISLYKRRKPAFDRHSIFAFVNFTGSVKRF
jgi:hypothetical protein